MKYGDTEIFVNNTDAFKIDERYQVFNNDNKGGFLLEFRVGEIKDESIVFKKKGVYNISKDNVIKKDSLIYQQLNFILIGDSSNIKISNIEFDGLNLGNVRGHLLYCGILTRNSARKARENKFPAYEKIIVENCKFKNLKGRAAAIYGTADVLIQKLLYKAKTEGIHFGRCHPQ